MNRLRAKMALAVALLASLAGTAACSPKECKSVMEAASPIQEMVEASNTSGLAAQVKALEAAAAGSSKSEIKWLAGTAGLLGKHIAAGSKPGERIPNYGEDKARLTQQFVDARRNVAGVCR